MQKIKPLSFLRSQPKHQLYPNKKWIIKVNDLTLMCFIGVCESEQYHKQPVRISLKCYANYVAPADRDSYYVCYNKLIEQITQYAERQHIDLVETFAEDICSMCLEYPAVYKVWVNIEKTKVYDNVSSVGVEVERERSESPNLQAV